METVIFSETSVATHESTLYNISEDSVIISTTIIIIVIIVVTSNSSSAGTHFERIKLNSSNLAFNDMIGYMIYLLTAIGFTPGGSSTVHIYTQTIHRTTQLTKKTNKIHININIKY